MTPEPRALNQRYTRSEVERMTGVSRSRLDYWARLNLVRPRARWGERFYNFGDLVALETLKQLAARRVPARRLHRALVALENQRRGTRPPLCQLRIAANGREVVVIGPPPECRPIEPLTGQFVLHFEAASPAEKVRTLASRSAEEWFEIGLACDSSPETLEQAAEAYHRALELSPNWIEAYINLGTALYQLERMQEAKRIFTAAAAIEPDHPLAHFNLGCVLAQLGDLDAAIEHLRRAIELTPNMADAHFNLALAYEKLGQKELARKHLSLYLHYEPSGPWAEFARSQVRPSRVHRRGKLMPFRTNSQGAEKGM